MYCLFKKINIFSKKKGGKEKKRKKKNKERKEKEVCFCNVCCIVLFI